MNKNNGIFCFASVSNFHDFNVLLQSTLDNLTKYDYLCGVSWLFIGGMPAAAIKLVLGKNPLAYRRGEFLLIIIKVMGGIFA